MWKGHVLSNKNQRQKGCPVCDDPRKFSAREAELRDYALKEAELEAWPVVDE